MAKVKTTYVCSECNYNSTNWIGICKQCGEASTMEEQTLSDSSNKAAHYGKSKKGYAGGASGKLLGFKDISGSKESRYDTKIGELNRVLGGGLVKGSVTLLVGNPGIGKSTILLQVMDKLSATLKTLYVSGEESLQQIKSRGERLKVNGDDMTFMSETNIDAIVSTAHDFKPEVMVIDSIQSMYSPESTSSPGGVAQLKESTAHITRYAKENDVAVILVGHVTKDGTLAGPKVLEHIIDASLFIEGEDNSRYRILRAMKNRFGAVNEIGVFAMMEDGLQEVKNPSKMFLSRHSDDISGGIVFVTREGTRPMLTEIQALVIESASEYPKRLALGLEINRISIILALLQKTIKLKTYDRDIYLNIIGGMKVTETASDLPVALSLISSYRDLIIPADVASFGEIGLSGEVRPVPNGEDRIKEAIKHGFKKIIVPYGNAMKKGVPSDVTIIGVKHLNEVLNLMQDFKKLS
jgi:DNA repair protein RadA/Sms